MAANDEFESYRTNANDGTDSIFCKTQDPYFQTNASADVVFDQWRWPKGDNITLYFMDHTDNENLIGLVMRCVEQWSYVCNVTFERVFIIESSHVRISFSKPVYSSVVGNLANESKDEATMQLGGLLYETQQAMQKRRVLHEFGHVLGLGHEHQFPEGTQSKIQWDEPQVYNHFRSHGYTDQWIKDNVLSPSTDAKASKFDPLSIMLYPFPRSLIKNYSELFGELDSTQTNVTLSEGDISAVRKLYGPPVTHAGIRVTVKGNDVMWLTCDPSHIVTYTEQSKASYHVLAQGYPVLLSDDWKKTAKTADPNHIIITKTSVLTSKGVKKCHIRLDYPEDKQGEKYPLHLGTGWIADPSKNTEEDYYITVKGQRGEKIITERGYVSKKFAEPIGGAYIKVQLLKEGDPSTPGYVHSRYLNLPVEVLSSLDNNAN